MTKFSRTFECGADSNYQGAEVCKSCRSRQELSNKIAIQTIIWMITIYLHNLASIQPRTGLAKFTKQLSNVGKTVRIKKLEETQAESFQISIRKVELGKPGNFEIHFKWTTCAFRVANLQIRGNWELTKLIPLVSYIITFWAAFRSELAAMAFLPFSLSKLYNGRSTAET